VGNRVFIGGAVGAGRDFVEGEVKLMAGSCGKGVGNESEVVEAGVVREVGGGAQVGLDVSNNVGLSGRRRKALIFWLRWEVASSRKTSWRMDL
jgi:hypothetical protein